MNRLAYAIILLLFPTLIFADSSLSFAPPPGDYSVIFLGNLFGIVDGVLSGSGSQIMGEMFKVFNSAVLALGGMVIMYTLLVSTINTAHKGQMMGEKWNSVWVPVRATLGLALLVPKASGYCLIQIIVMWVVVQGVGAADKVWNAALSYLNRGGLIVQSQINPMKALTGNAAPIAKGASVMLSGQVCMLGVQKALQQTREYYLHPQGTNSNQGSQCGPDGSIALQTFCKNTVPDFIQSVDIIGIQDLQSGSGASDGKVFTAPMPNFSAGNPYAVFNGICGTLSWKAISASDAGKMSSVLNSKADTKVASKSRAIAIQQMYTNLSSVAQLIVNNNPAFNKTSNADKSKIFSPYAKNQFGIPINSAGTPCTAANTSDCTSWGSDGSDTSALLSGTEFQSALQSYAGVMNPTRRIIAEATDKNRDASKRDFIKKAEASGWIMAGSYFINLARINSANPTDKDLSDKQTGLDASTFDLSDLNTVLTNKTCGQGSPAATLCTWFQGQKGPIQAVVGMINGSPDFKVADPTNTLSERNFISGKGASTVFGYISNAANINMPGQPGQAAPNFGLTTNFDFKASVFEAPEISYSCQMWYAFCIDSIVVNVGYNLVFRFIFNMVLKTILSIAKLVIMAFLTVPLQGMAQIFIHGVSFIQQPSVNPIIALANMGVNYINFAMDLWITLIQLSAILFLLLPLLLMIYPLLLVWIGTMSAIGFLTAYYIPFLPYMIFTFGTIAWLMAVIEAMVAAPIVALGITHPEGEGAFGKGEQAIMLLMNVFLRPAMMIIGYISGIALSYVSVWIINAGFANVVSFIQGDLSRGAFNVVGDPKDLYGNGGVNINALKPSYALGIETNPNPNDYKVSAAEAGRIDTTVGYTGWAGIYGFFFSILTYTTIYIIVVQKSFGLITALPDKVLRWIAGGQQESLGADTTQWSEESKQKISEAGKETGKAGGEIGSKMGDSVTKQMPKGGGKGKVDVS